MVSNDIFNLTPIEISKAHKVPLSIISDYDDEFLYLEEEVPACVCNSLYCAKDCYHCYAASLCDDIFKETENYFECNMKKRTRNSSVNAFDYLCKGCPIERLKEFG